MRAKPLATFTMNADRSEVRSAADWLNKTTLQFAVPQGKSIALDQCLDEVLMNILMHGGDSASSTPIELSFDMDPKAALVTVSDSGIPFNPVHAPIKPRPASLEDAEPGGLGLSIIKGLCNHLDYRYQNGRNILTFSVSI